MKNTLLILASAALLFSSCEKWLNPDLENLKTIEQMHTDARYAQGFLTTAYRTIPGYYDNSDVATDDAVTNQRSHPYLQIATGSWTPTFNPTSVWGQSYGAMQYLNIFLENSNLVDWAEDPEAAQLFNIRMRGEAFGLRALYIYYLLRNHGGINASGELMGVPLMTQSMPSTADFNVPRASFMECINQIYMDLDSADAYLPMQYNNVATAAQIPEHLRKYSQDVSAYNRVMGEYSRQLFDGLISKAFRARTALLAASPYFQHTSNNSDWATAANAAASVINFKGGISGLPNNGHTYYDNRNEIDNLSNGTNPPEMIWREVIQPNNSDQELQNLPPSLFGNALVNPTQNLVDAFPMANGYPINHSENSGGYNAATPYADRDPRLNLYIIYNGSTAGVSNRQILTGSASGTADAINARETSSRTGYYMRKRLRADVNLDPVNTVRRNRYYPRVRYTEIYLSYAEAANEAWGPDGTGGNAYSAYDVIKAIRQRAGVGATNNDPYLEECRADKDKMRALIRNERRLELCFESFRFWDLRRWKMPLTESATGMDINGSNYQPIPVEGRTFQNHMYYGPIPFSEVLKYSNLQQNTGWE
ncbi:MULTISPECIES: RagB/SusD family nutrient uptake outer membrane protein [Sphingobacterium]|uniref:RagB/SusD family nutrient uptake outer membrane protein n=1 Tax=Sphingobacterium populi TaxID=1812824 RepID=A0ABW5UJ21_9SPHI|nr:RagB/SusD family nutrient uptake outer membrane protein [Sphingobacterium sp. CFCC 11742]